MTAATKIIVAVADWDELSKKLRTQCDSSNLFVPGPVKFLDLDDDEEKVDNLLTDAVLAETDGGKPPFRLRRCFTACILS
jgi:hypothetical protein